MSILTKGLGTSVGRGGAIVTKGLQTLFFVPPSYIPRLERVEAVQTPDLVSARTPTSMYRIIIVWLRGWVYGY